jgi:hypothetical protein
MGCQAELVEAHMLNKPAFDKPRLTFFVDENAYSITTV